MDKPQLRAKMRKRRRALSAPLQRLHGEEFLNNIITTRVYQLSRTIACYMPVSGELDTRPLMEHALASGRQVYVPVIEGSAMWFAQFTGKPLPIDRASNLPQPLKRDMHLKNVRMLDLVVMPLVAFARNGKRLGQGGGYYDRTFAYQRSQSWCRPRLIGAAHHFQETDDIPTDPWDVPLSGIITNREIIV